MKRKKALVSKLMNNCNSNKVFFTKSTFCLSDESFSTLIGHSKSIVNEFIDQYQQYLEYRLGRRPNFTAQDEILLYLVSIQLICFLQQFLEFLKKLDEEYIYMYISSCMNLPANMLLQ